MNEMKLKENKKPNELIKKEKKFLDIKSKERKKEMNEKERKNERKK